MMDRAPTELAQAEVIDEAGQPHRVDELWRDRPAVIHFVRHFG
jgi:hypothetical protein